MSRAEHKFELLQTVDPEWGRVRSVLATADNSACAVVMEEGDHDVSEKKRTKRFVFNGYVPMKLEANEVALSSLSPDGTKLACVRIEFKTDEDGNPICLKRGTKRIVVNGRERYRVNYEYIGDLEWIGEDRLAWTVGDGNRRERTIVNGEDKTHEFTIERVGKMHPQYRAIVTLTDGTKFWVLEDGSWKPILARVERDDESEWEARKLRPRVQYDRDQGNARVVWNGASGPVFDHIPDHVIVSEDGVLAYVGVRREGLIPKIHDLGGRLLGWTVTGERGEPRGLVKPLAWIFTMLYNPYLGLLYFADKLAIRHYPVNGSQVWQKGYRSVGNFFFAPDGSLVATCEDREYTERGVRVVIDEQEGPLVDQVWHVRCLPTGEVCYIAKKGNQMLRVVVH